MKFDFKIVPYRKMRYPTVGDYFRKLEVWQFRVARLPDKRYCWIVFLHEIIEWTLCRLTGVGMRAITKFDMEYEAARGSHRSVKAPCGCWHYDEPGDDPHAPYFDAHQAATACERIIAHGLRIKWSDYSAAVKNL